MRLDILKKACAEKSIIGFRTTEFEWDRLLIGFIVKLTDDSFIVNVIDKNGFFVGNSEIPFDKLINIDNNDRHQKRLSFIHENRSLFDANKSITVWKEKGAIISYLKELIDNKQIVTLLFGEDEYISGFIIKYDELDIMIKKITEDGDEDGESCYPIDEIIGIRYNGIEEQKIKLLYENKDIFY